MQGMLREVEGVMWEAMEEAEVAMHAGELTVDPKVEREARRRRWGAVAEVEEEGVEMSVKL